MPRLHSLLAVTTLFATTLFATTLFATGVASGVPPVPTPEPRAVIATEVLGLTSSGALVFRRGATLYRVEPGARDAHLADASPLGGLSPVPLGLAAPGGAAVVFPMQLPAESVPGTDGPTGVAANVPSDIAPERPIRLVRVDGDGDDVLGELQPPCQKPKSATKPGRRGAPPPAPASVDRPALLDLTVAWTPVDVVVLGSLSCGGQSEPFVVTAPLRPAIADGAHESVAAGIEAPPLSSIPAVEWASALATLEPSSPRRLAALAEAHALAGDAAAAVSALWRLLAVGPTARPSLDKAMASDWATTLEDRVAFRALVLSTAPKGASGPPSIDDVAPPPEASP